MENPYNKETHPNCFDGHNYALDIVNKKIRANKWVIGACNRYLNDLKRIIEDTECPFYFLEDKAEKYLRIVQRFCHAVGHWETKEIIYEPWQKFAWMNIKGFYAHKTKCIRYRTAHLDIARGNGKTPQASQAGLYDLCCDNPNGDRIYCAATSRDQAKEVLDGARIMAAKNESYIKNFGIDVRAHEILHPSSNSYMRAISAQANSLDGKVGKLVITDELHAMQRKTFEVLDSGQSKRRDSLLLAITTAGYASDGVGYSQRKYAMKVALGEVDDDTFFSLVYCMDEELGHDIHDPENWIMANPNFGVSVDPDNFAAKSKKAKENPEDSANFKIKHCNMYLGSLHQFFDPLKWKGLRDTRLVEDTFKGKECYVGIDVATTEDICSVAYVFRDGESYSVFFRNFIPKDRIDDQRNRSYLRYVDEGDLIPMEGNEIDLTKVEDDIIKYSKIFKFIDVHYDPYNATEMSTVLLKNGVNAVKFSMNVGNLSEPTKKLKRLMQSGNLSHNTGDMLEWCLGNVACKHDANENVYPRKEHQRNKIDPIIAMLMAFAGWVSREGEQESVYERRGMITI